LYSNHLSAQLDQDYLNQNGHHNNASVHCKKKYIFRKKDFETAKAISLSIASG
jgi:hypothetical protein